MKKVVFYGKHRKLPLFVGDEDACFAWIMKHASKHTKYTDKDGKEKIIFRTIKDPDGVAYDVGQVVIYQIVEANTDETEGICQ